MNAGGEESGGGRYWNYPVCPTNVLHLTGCSVLNVFGLSDSEYLQFEAIIAIVLFIPEVPGKFFAKGQLAFSHEMSKFTRVVAKTLCDVFFGLRSVCLPLIPPFLELRLWRFIRLFPQFWVVSIMLDIGVLLWSWEAWRLLGFALRDIYACTALTTLSNVRSWREETITSGAKDGRRARNNLDVFFNSEMSPLLFANSPTINKHSATCFSKLFPSL